MRARRRLSLLAGGSLAAALISASGTVLAPTPALAANECGDPTINGGTADVFDCAGSQAAIGYATSGNLTLRMNNGVATTTGGVVVTSTLTDTVTISRIDAPANTGDPSLVSTGGAGISVVSSGTGAISVNLSDTDASDGVMLNVQGTTAGVLLTGGATTGTAISLTTTNGAITATTGAGVQTTSSSIAGGATALTLGGSVSGATGIQTTVNGTGGQTVTLSAGSGGDVSGVAGSAVLMSAGSGASSLTVGAGRTVRANGAASAVVEMANAAGSRTITNGGTIRANDAVVNPYAALAVRIGSGTGAVTLTNSAGAVLSGRVLLLSSGTASIANSGTWHAADFSALGLGATTLTNNTASVIATGAGGLATTLDFETGADLFTNAGTLAAGEGGAAASTLTLQGLEAWANSGKVLFGANAGYTSSDGAANDRIVAATAFTGSGASALVMDVDFTGAQASCAAAVTADCLDLRGGSAGGTTSIVVNAVGAGRALAGRIVLVDVAGGFSGDTRFKLSPASTGYALNADGEAIIDAGILHYDFVFDDDADQHILVGAPDAEAMEVAMLATAAREAWDQAAGTAFDRGSDLRRGQDVGGGAWMRIVGRNIDQTVGQSFTLGGVTTGYDSRYEQDVVALVGGADIVRAGWTLGLTAAHLDSDTGFTGTSTTQSLQGYALGAYASFTGGPAYVDAIVSRTSLDVTYDVPSLGGRAEGQATSTGFQAEAGWRLAVPDMPAFVEPLVAVSYVKTRLDEMALPGVAATFEDVADVRAGLGLRVTGEAAARDWTTRFTFTGRVWEEFDGQSEVTLTNAALNLPLTYDDPKDRLGDIGFNLAALGLGERLSLQLGLRLQFKRDYENRELSAGVRYLW